jgi:hypothetical protein
MKSKTNLESKIKLDRVLDDNAMRLSGVLRAFALRVVSDRRGKAAPDQADLDVAPAEVATAEVALGNPGAPPSGDRIGEPQTLHRLGVPRELATELEATFKAMGATRGGRVAGFEFRTPGGLRHPVLLEEERESGDRAA